MLQIVPSNQAMLNTQSDRSIPEHMTTDTTLPVITLKGTSYDSSQGENVILVNWEEI